MTCSHKNSLIPKQIVSKRFVGTFQKTNVFGSRLSGLVDLPIIKHYNVPGTGMYALHTMNITFKFHTPGPGSSVG